MDAISAPVAARLSLGLEPDHLGVPRSGKGIAFNVIDQAVESIGSVDQFLDDAEFNSLRRGKHKIDVHGEDAAGNWGSFQSIQFTKVLPSKTAATVSALASRRNSSHGLVFSTKAADAAIAALLLDWPGQRPDNAGPEPG
jgi:hypothetical protein